MKRLIVIAIAAGLLATGSAEARVSVSAYDTQGLTAALALNEIVGNYTTGGVSADQGLCKPFKRNRARCGEKVAATLIDGTPVRCWVQIIVTVRRWHFPPESFGCPADWLPPQ